MDIIRFSVAGTLSVAVQFAVLVGLVEFARINPTLSSALGFFFSCFVNYLILYYWAFPTKGRHRVIVARYAVVMLATMGLSVLIFWIFNAYFHVWYPLSQIVATVVISLANFFINREYTFV
ncbi:MAG: GtrA family protein [Waddliaceae bacterium]